MLNIAKKQNETISELWSLLKKNHGIEAVEAFKSVKSKEIEILGVKNSAIPSPQTVTLKYFETPKASLEKECENRYGMALINEWIQNRQEWCVSDESLSADMKSELVCFPYHQVHKKLDGRGADLICEATNFFVDFSKVTFSIF